MKKPFLLPIGIFLYSLCRILYGNFIFVSEIPIYLSFEDHNDKQLIEKEKIFTSENYITISSKTMKDVEYSISEDKWRGTPKYYKKVLSTTERTLNFEEDKANLLKLISLFEKESFGVTAEESKTEASEKLRIVLLANRMKSIFVTKNQSLKIQHNDLGYDNVLVLRGSWEPKWVKSKGNKKVEVNFNEVRRYMRFCLQEYKNSLKPEEQREWLKK